MPIQYTGIISEHLWTRRNASLFDICHMGEFTIRADAAKSGFERLVTFRLSDMAAGACRYGFILNNAGGIIDDLIVYRISADEWMVVINAATIEKDAAHFRKNLNSNASFENVSDRLGKLDLQGPRSLDVLKKLVGPTVTGLRYYGFSRYDLLGEKVIISRTGYTGELGYELYISNDKVKDLWRLILADELVRPGGLGARDTLRLEMCYPLYGQDLTEETTPVEGDKEAFIDPDKEFLGRHAMTAANRPYRRLVYFMADSRRSPRHNYRIMVSGHDAGFVTSGSFSPSLSRGIGMGYVTVPCPVGTAILLKDNAVEIPAVVTDKPFYKNGTAKK